MDSNNPRLTEPGAPPTSEQIASWLGDSAMHFWNHISNFISQNYPGIFTPDWLFGGKKHGWSLRYKKSRSFCTMIPEKNRVALLIVFGKNEREKVETIKHELSLETRTAYDEAKTYHDGKWLLLHIESEEILADIKKLLFVKRKPKKLRTQQ